MGKKQDKNQINTQDASEKQPFFNSLHKLRTKVKDGTYREILDDWKWIFGYSKRYKGVILLETLLGLFSSTFAMVASVASKYVIDIITGHKT